MWFRLHEKGGKYHTVPAHHKAVEYLDQYLLVAGAASSSPLFRSMNRNGRLGDNRMSRTDALRMLKRRTKAAKLTTSVCCHTWRATGITAYMKNGGSLEQARQIAAHESTKTTMLYDRRQDSVTIDEIERIRLL